MNDSAIPGTFGFWIRIAGSILYLTLGVQRSGLAQDSSAVADSLLLLELQQEMAQPEPAPQPQTRASKVNLNPDISLIGDLRTWWQSEGDRNVDMEVHEVETALRSVVDPYARADVYLSMGHNNGEFAFEVEEAYVTSLALPYRLQARAGKFRSTFGRINRIHPHALPFLDVPAVYANFLGEEGLNDQGISLSWLLPNSSFFQELTVEATRGPADNESFAISEGNRLLYTGHLKNFWDLTENATFELGLSGVIGPNDFDETTTLGGVDLTYKWKPLRQNTYRSLTLQAEGIVSDRSLPDGSSITSSGFYALVMYQLSQRWHGVLRYDFSDRPDDNAWNETGLAGFLGWYATEFQKIEFGLKTATGDHFDRTYQALARLVFVIGSHGAHQY